MSIPERDQISLEHETLYFYIEPCDIQQYRENLEDHNHYYDRVTAKHSQIPTFNIDPACGCNFIKNQKWRPDNWSTLVEQNQQQHIQDYEMLYLY